MSVLGKCLIYGKTLSLDGISKLFTLDWIPKLLIELEMFGWKSHLTLPQFGELSFQKSKFRSGSSDGHKMVDIATWMDTTVQCHDLPEPYSVTIWKCKRLYTRLPW